MDKFLYKHPKEETLPDIPNAQFLASLTGVVETVIAAPTGNPTRMIDQMKFYTDSISAPTVYKLYIYSTALKVWKSVTLT